MSKPGTADSRVRRFLVALSCTLVFGLALAPAVSASIPTFGQTGTVTPGTPPALPASDYHLNSVVSSGQVVLTWISPAVAAGRLLQGFHVYRAGAAELLNDPGRRITSSPTAALATGMPSETATYTFTDNAAPGRYFYAVQAIYSDGSTGVLSAAVETIVTVPAGQDSTVPGSGVSPAAPAKLDLGLRAVVEEGRVSLTWNPAPGGASTDKYQVYRSSGVNNVSMPENLVCECPASAEPMVFSDTPGPGVFYYGVVWAGGQPKLNGAGPVRVELAETSLPRDLNAQVDGWRTRLYLVREPGKADPTEWLGISSFDFGLDNGGVMPAVKLTRPVDDYSPDICRACAQGTSFAEAYIGVYQVIGETEYKYYGISLFSSQIQTVRQRFDPDGAGFTEELTIAFASAGWSWFQTPASKRAAESITGGAVNQQ